MSWSEFDQVLGGTLRELEYELEAESEPSWSTRNLIEFQSLPNGVFLARISGFDLHSAASPDPDVIGLHVAAADRIAREIVARANQDRMVIFPVSQCVNVIVTGFVDLGSESDTRDFGLGSTRAKAFWARVEARVNTLADIPRGVICRNAGKAGASDMFADVPLFPSSSQKGRHLNRRVVVKVSKGDCPPECQRRKARRP